MVRGDPNNEEMKLNFVAKVWDEKANDGQGAYKPIYVAPDATSNTRGDVYLSDAVDGTDNAETGVTAATPAAVKAVNDKIDDKVSKSDLETQSIKSSLNPDVTDTQDLGTEELKWNDIYANKFHGELDGNATTASTLKTPRNIGIKNGEAEESKLPFDGAGDITIPLNSLDASTLTVGEVPLARLPKAALERLVIVQDLDAMYDLTTDTVQLGDTVQLEDTKAMYYVVDESNLDNEKGYVEYVAATAAKATEADKLSDANVGSSSHPVYFSGGKPVATSGTTGSTSCPVYISNGVPTGISALSVSYGGTGATTANDAWTALGGGNIGKMNSTGSTSYFLRADGQWAAPPTSSGSTTDNDYRVQQAYSSNSSSYPILLRPVTSGTTTTTTTAYYSGVSITPSTNTINGNLSGTASYATSAGTASGLSSTLGVSYGGTGNTSLTSNQVVLGNGSSALKTTSATGTGALYRTSTTGAPSFGVLPVAQGGTGVTSISELQNLVGGGGSSSDVNVTQNATTTNASYPILLKGTTTSGSYTGTVYFDSGVTLNPYTNMIAANISGNAATATTATSATTATTASGLSSTLSINGGGTGVTTLTSNQVVLGNGTSALKTTSASGTGALYRTGTTSAPSFGTLGVSYGGTGTTSLTSNQVVLGSGTGALKTTSASGVGILHRTVATSAPTFGPIKWETVNVTYNTTSSFGGTKLKVLTSPNGEQRAYVCGCKALNILKIGVRFGLASGTTITAGTWTLLTLPTGWRPTSKRTLYDFCEIQEMHAPEAQRAHYLGKFIVYIQSARSNVQEIAIYQFPIDTSQWGLT